MTTQEISIEINEEIDRVLPLISTSDNYYGAYKDGLQFALNIVLIPPKELIGWRCTLCGKDEFDRKSLHKCTKSHRRGIKWLPIYEK